MAAALRTPVGMLSFPHLFVPKPVVAGGEPRFSLSLVFDKTALSSPEYQALRQAVAEAIDAEFGKGKSRDVNFLRGLRLPFRKAEDKQYAGYEPGKMFISPWTKNKPGLVDGQLRDITAPADVWAGQLARCTVAPFAYSQGANKGVNFMLNNVQITDADQPRMDGRKNASQDFDPVAGASAPGFDPDDAAPF